MKILRFEEFNLNEQTRPDDKKIIKWYGESFPIADVKIGQKVIYKGISYWVHDGSDVYLLLGQKKRSEKSTEQDFVKVNQAMFNQSAVLKNEFDDESSIGLTSKDRITE